MRETRRAWRRRGGRRRAARPDLRRRRSSPAGDVDDMRAARQLRQRRVVEEAPGRARRRQQADENARSGEEWVQFGLAPRTTGRPQAACGVALQAKSGKANGASAPATAWPSTPKPSMPTPNADFAQAWPRLPATLRAAAPRRHRASRYARSTASVTYSAICAAIPAFSRRITGIPSGSVGTPSSDLDAGAEIEDRPRRPDAREELRGWLPDERVIDRGGRIRPDGNHRFRKRGRRARRATFRPRRAALAAGSSCTQGRSFAIRHRYRRGPPLPSRARRRGSSRRPRRRPWVRRSCAPSSSPRGSSAAHPSPLGRRP